MSDKIIQSLRLKLKSELVAAQDFISRLRADRSIDLHQSEVLLLLEDNINTVAKCKAALEALNALDKKNDIVASDDKKSPIGEAAKTAPPKNNQSREPQSKLQKLAEMVGDGPLAKELHSQMAAEAHEVNEKKAKKTLTRRKS